MSRRKKPKPDESRPLEGALGVLRSKTGGIRFRIYAVLGLLAIGFGMVASAAWDVMVRDGESWRELAERQRQRRLRIVPKRGTIYDRNGLAMAVSVEVPSASVDAYEVLRTVPPQQVPVVARDSANRIAAALSLDPAVVERKILSKRRFAWLKRDISIEEAAALRRLSSRKALGERRIRGIVVEGEGRRYYPRREVASALLGFVAPDGIGKDGIELSLDADLRGHVEQLRGLRDRRGRLLFADGMQDDQALAGHDIYLTIDQGIQHAAEAELANVARTFEASGGSVIAVDPRTGEILAMATWPGYNPNDYRRSTLDSRRDRGLSDPFEPGSTMKIFTVAAGLAGGAITPTQKLYCEKGMMPVDNVVIRDTHPAGWLTISQVLSYSSNICSAKIGLALGGNKLYEAFRRFGFGQTTAVPLPGEASGTLRPRGRPWVQVETAASSFGQGISVTNLQMVMATAALANGGKLMEPLLVKRAKSATGEVLREAVPKVRRRVVSRNVARTVLEMMIAVTEGDATGVEAAIDGYHVAGKTATAQKTDPKTGRYSLDHYIASFVGFVPARKPEVVISVMIDEPMVDHAGGSVAAPLFRRLAQRVLEYRGLTPKGTKRAKFDELARKADPAHGVYEAIRLAEGKRPPVQEVELRGAVAAGRVRVPDMTGWPVREAVRRLVELGLQPKVLGTGLLSRQVPGPGSVVEKGDSLKLVFEPAT